MKKSSYKKLFAVVVLFMAVCMIPAVLLAQEDQDEPTEEGRKYSPEAQAALVEAQRRYETNPEDLAAAREPLITFLATPQEEPIPIIMYQMLGQFWYADEKSDKRIEEAQKIYKQGFEAFPEDDGMLLNYAVTTYEMERFEDAAPLFEKYYELNEAHDIKYLGYAAAAYYTAAAEYEDLDKARPVYDEAKRVYLRMIGLQDPPESSWLDSLIYICQAQEDMAEVEKYVKLALNTYRMEKKYWTLIANIYLEKEDYKGGTAAYEIGTRVEIPDKKSEWRTLVDLYNYLRLPLRSAESIQMGLDLLAEDSTEEEQQLAVAEAYYQGARVDKAVSYLDAAIAKNPSYDLKLKKATILYEARRNEEALVALDECLAEKPNAYDVHYMKAWIYWDLKDWDAAEESFTEASNSKEETIRNYTEYALDRLASLETARTE